LKKRSAIPTDKTIGLVIIEGMCSGAKPGAPETAHTLHWKEVSGKDNAGPVFASPLELKYIDS
jgi:hypothetical protein